MRPRKVKTDAMQQARNEIREKAVKFYSTHLLEFVRDVICYKEPNNCINEETHGDICRLLQDMYWGTAPKKVPDNSIHSALINVPRGGLKSTIITVGFPVWIMLQNRTDRTLWQPPRSFNGKRGADQRINISHETAPESQKYLGLIAWHLNKNEKIKVIWGDDVFWRKKTEGRWSAWELDVPWREDFTAREANISTSSLRGSIAGGHYDITIWDDIFTETTVSEESGIERTMNYYRNYIPVAHLPSLLFVVGTRKHDGDLYGYIQEKEADKWNIIVEKAWRGPTEIAAGQRELWFPQKHSVEIFLDIKERMGDDYFSCEFQNEPLDPTKAPFKTEWFSNSYFTPPAEPSALRQWITQKNLQTYVLSDPAVADNKKSCLCTIVTVGVDHNGHFWILDAWGEKGIGEDPKSYIDELYRQSETYGVLWTAVESVGLQRMIKWPANQRGLETGRYLNWFELKPGGRSKDARILGLRNLARQGGIHLQPQHVQIFSEFTRFPKGKSRDFVDAIAYTPDVAVIPENMEDRQSEVDQARKAAMEEFRNGGLMKLRAERMGIPLPGMDEWNDEGAIYDAYN